MNAKRFFYVAAGILLLVIAYSIGAHRANAQVGGNFVSITSTWTGTRVALFAVTSDGDVYLGQENYPSDCSWLYCRNIRGGAIQVEGKTWGGVKDQYRK